MRLTFDIEGNGLTEVTKGKNYEKEATKIHCISAYDIDTKDTYLFYGATLQNGVDLLRKADLLIGHNILAYDIPLIERLYGSLNKRPYYEVFDTIIVSRMLWPDMLTNPLPNGSHSLKAWGEYLREAKSEYKGGWDKYSQQMGAYCVQDSIVTAAVYSHQTYLPYIKTYEPAVVLEHEVANIIRAQVENGFSYDYAAAEILESTLLMEKSLIEDSLRKIFPDRITERFSTKTGKKLKDDLDIFNPGSRQQIAERLSSKYGWEPPETEKGNPQVSEEILSKLPYPEATVLCEYFDSSKLLSQVTDWGKRANISRDSRVHGSINTLGTVTGRMTSKEPNMQQVHSDPRARSLFIPRPNMVLVGADLKGLELRMLAHYLHPFDGGSYADVVTKGDVHTHNKEAMGLDDRNTAKTAIYCFLYGGGDEKFASTIKSTISKARKTKDNLLKNIPGLQMLVNTCKSDSRSKGVVFPFSHRPIPVRKEHAALNTLLQSSGALVSKYWLNISNTLLETNLPKGSFYWVANVHDEVQLECTEQYAKQAGEYILEAALAAGVALGCSCKIEAEYTIGYNWSQTH